jgi:carbon starvation protein
LLAPAASAADMGRIIFNDTVDVAMTAVFITVVMVMLAAGVLAARQAVGERAVSTREVPDDMHLLRQNI